MNMIRISAKVDNRENENRVTLKTMDNAHSIVIPSKSGGFGSSVNGGEALFLALATCYCNDIYREAEQQRIVVKSVVIEVEGDFDGVPGHIAENVVYHATVEANATQEEIEALIRHTDTVAEIQNTLRQGIPVDLKNVTAVSRGE